MAKIKAVDMRLLDEVFASPHGPGYVLDFSDRTFLEFFRDDIEVDIELQKYHQNGRSKLNRLRTFLQIEPEPLAARALRELWNYREAVYGPYAKDEKTRQQQDRFFQLVHAMDGKGGPVRKQDSNAAGRVTPPAQTLADLSRRLIGLSAMKAQERGFAFERFLNDLFALHGLDPRGSFRLVGEQIDGSFQIGQEVYLLEAKWQDAQTGQADLLIFSGKVEGKATGALGLFVSYGGFSNDGLQAFARGRRTSILCMDGLDLAHVLSGQLSLAEVIARKRRRALETNSAFVPVRELFMSVT